MEKIFEIIDWAFVATLSILLVLIIGFILGGLVVAAFKGSILGGLTVIGLFTGSAWLGWKTV